MAAGAILVLIKEHGVEGPNRIYLVHVHPSPRLPHGQWFVATGPRRTLGPISDRTLEEQFGPFEIPPGSTS